jgi:hypothetical protein
MLLGGGRGRGGRIRLCVLGLSGLVGRGGEDERRRERGERREERTFFDDLTNEDFREACYDLRHRLGDLLA